MMPVSREDFERLKKAKLIKFAKNEKNFTITSAKKKSHRKKYYVNEERKILNFLGIKKY